MTHANVEKLMKTIIVSIGLLATIVACTTTNEIIIDQKGVDMSRYEDDLDDCEGYAEQVAIGKKAAKGSASGAVTGGAIGAVSKRSDAGEGAAIGAITGGVKGLNEGEHMQLRVVKNCLRGRGYKILN
ncbi:MAG: outer membrane lipoprotein SlyB [Rhodothermales bacterium]